MGPIRMGLLYLDATGIDVWDGIACYVCQPLAKVAGPGQAPGSNRWEDRNVGRTLRFDEQEVRELKKALEKWSRRSKKEVTLNGLLNGWAEFVRQVERGYTFSIYDYINDLSVRDVSVGGAAVAGVRPATQMAEG